MMQPARIFPRFACRASPTLRSQRFVTTALQGTPTQSVQIPKGSIDAPPTAPDPTKNYTPPSTTSPPASRKLVRKTWGHKAEGHTFNLNYATEFRQSQIQGAGNGWWACVDIPAGVRMRRVSVEDGTLLRFGSEAELRSAGWDIDDAVNYGIGHHKDPSGIYFLNPGTAMNHADKTRDASVRYIHDEEGAIELWTIKAIKAGEEMFNDYSVDFGRCEWYDKMQQDRGNTPLAWLDEAIDKLYTE